MALWFRPHAAAAAMLARNISSSVTLCESSSGKNCVFLFVVLFRLAVGFCVLIHLCISMVLYRMDVCMKCARLFVLSEPKNVLLECTDSLFFCSSSWSSSSTLLLLLLSSTSDISRSHRVSLAGHSLECLHFFFGWHHMLVCVCVWISRSLAPQQ